MTTPRDQREDQVGLAAGGCPRSARGRTTLRMTSAVDDAEQHEHREEVDEQREPALVPEPRERLRGGRRRRSSRSRSSGSRTRKPQKMNACISPGTSRCSSLRWPSTSIASLRTRAPAGRRGARPAARRGRAGRGSSARRANRPPPTHEQRGQRRARRRATAMRPRLLRSSAADRRDDLVQVADHGVVGAREDRRLGVGVDREHRLRALAARDVLGRAADPAGDVEVGRDLRARSGRPGRSAAASPRSSRRASSRRRRRAGRRAPR